MISVDREHDNWLKAALTASAECFSIEELAALPDGAAGHVAACPRCQAELAMLKEFGATVPPDGQADVTWIVRRLEARLRPERMRQNRTAPRRWRAWFAAPSVATFALASASVAALVFAGELQLRRTAAPVLMARAGSAGNVMRSEVIPVLGPAGELDGSPRQLAWRPVAGAAWYEVSLMEVDGVEVWRGAIPRTSIALPASIRKHIVPGKPLLWRVVAFDPAGRPLTASQTQRFRLSIPRPSRHAQVQVEEQH